MTEITVDNETTEIISRDLSSRIANPEDSLRHINLDVSGADVRIVSENYREQARVGWPVYDGMTITGLRPQGNALLAHEPGTAPATVNVHLVQPSTFDIGEVHR